MTGDLDKTIRAYETERQVYVNLSTASDRPPPAVDILELYAGTAKPTMFAKECGLRAAQPLDIEYGMDLSDTGVQAQVRKAVDRLHPWLLVIGYPCTHYNLMNENANYHHRMDVLNQIRHDDAPMRKFVRDLMLRQHSSGRLFLLENPATSRLWKQTEIVEVTSTPGVGVTTCHAGAFGAESRDGQPVQKTLRFAGNDPDIINDLTRKLSQTDLLYCKPIQGSDTKASQVYPDAMAWQIVQSLREWIRRRDPQRFGFFEAFVSARPVVENSVEWDPVFDQVKKLFSDNVNKRPFLIDTDGELGKAIANLLRMDVVRIQAAHLPAQRRLPLNVAFRARGAALLRNDDTVTVETETLDSIQFPKQRFDKPVTIGLFAYGEIGSEPLPPQGEVPLGSFPTDIKFEGISASVPLDVKRTVARLHINMGHPSPQELIRLMCCHGPPSQSMLEAIRNLQCSTCQRLQLPQHPRPSSLPSLEPRQFCDEVQSDIVYVRTATGEAVPVLGLVDVATNLHQATCLKVKNSESTFEAIEKTWLKPYGLPVKFRFDPDPLYQGHCKDRLEAMGITVEFCAPESHWQIAHIERRNTVLRTILEKMIDTRAATNLEEMESLMAPTLHALNSTAMTKGRSAYQCVFGRLPRLPGCNLLADPVALGSSPGDAAICFEQVRAEALRHLAEFSVDRGIRRAILRKTRATAISELSPGEPCAYWRWRKKGVHKKGGWSMARFLAWGPENVGKQAWLRSGTTTILVAAEQLRAAVSFERWQPSEDDIKMLKDGNQSLKDSLWEDQSGPGPPQEEVNLDDIDVDGLLSSTMPATPVVMPGTPQAPRPQLPLPQVPHASTIIDSATYHEHHEHNVQQNINVSSPTYNRVVVQRLGEPPRGHRSRSRMPGTPRRGRSPGPPRPAQAPSLPTVVPEELANIELPRALPAPPTPQPSEPHTYSQQPSQTEAIPEPQQQPPQVPEADTAVLEQSAPNQTEALREPQQQPPQVPSGPSEQPGEVAAPGVPPELPPQVESAASSPPLPTTPVTSYSTSSAPDPTPLPQLPQKRNFDAVVTLVMEKCTIRRANPDKCFDDFSTGSRSFYDCYLNSPHREADLKGVEKEAQDSDTSDSDTSDSDPEVASSGQSKHSRPLSRKELKQLDREVPWRQLLKLLPKELDEYVASAVKEARSWLHWDSVEALTAAQVKGVLSTPQLRRRILKSRAVFRDKARGQGPLRAKCRVVCLGHLDPDLKALTRDAPTPSRMAEHVIFMMMVAGINKEIETSNLTWHC